jgi:hypothetical protein
LGDIAGPAGPNKSKTANILFPPKFFIGGTMGHNLRVIMKRAELGLLEVLGLLVRMPGVKVMSRLSPCFTEALL